VTLLAPRTAPPLSPAPAGRSPTATLVACPDARPPAYQAAAGLAAAGALSSFLTGFYDRGPGPLRRAARRAAPATTARLDRWLGRRNNPAIPAARVRSSWSFDLALAAERRLGDGPRAAAARLALARWRTDRFDRAIAAAVAGPDRPSAALLFSDTATDHGLPACRREGLRSVLSVVHGDVLDECAVLDRLADRSPEFLDLYLGDARLDRAMLDWLHDRRLREAQLADLVLVPSTAIAESLARRGVPADRIRVVPYAADTRRFRPSPDWPRRGTGCTFLFAGGISVRKGVHDLLRAWKLAARPGWRLRLLGSTPRDPGPLGPLLDQPGVELAGRVPHSEVPEAMAEADAFAFPSLFEGSAVVTYEALASGLPLVTTAAAGSVARHGVEGLIVPPGDVEALAAAIERLGNDPEFRAASSAAARQRALEFDWPRYHRAVLDACTSD